MINGAVKSNYLASKFLLDNLKKDRQKILRAPFLKGYGVSLYGKDVEQKIYYDTQDAFFHKVGITININKHKGANKAELVVRYNKIARRIEFLENIPDTFAIEIGLHSDIKDNIDFITKAIYELIPNGVSADVKQLLTTATPIMIVDKKRERYRIIHINGLKVLASFSSVVYSNKMNGKREKVELVELESAANKAKEFNDFTKLVRFEFPNLIKANESDLEYGLEICRN